MYKLYCRIYQSVFKLVSYLLPWRKPELTQGANSLKKLPKLIKSKGINSVLIVTDKIIASLGLLDELLKGLSVEGVDFVVYDRTVPNPTIDNIEEALQIYKANNCQGIVAFGGGSPMDCAKGVGARVARPRKTISQMKGVFKVLKKIPPLFAIPTTSGTGSETTIAAVITDSKTHEKYAINDTSLIPHYAVLDPVLTINLPPHITSTTGIDALTHAVEAYIGRSNTTQTKQLSREAIKLIFANIFEAYSNGTNLVARANMQQASYLAGLAFTRAYVGYVHAIAHTLGGFYSAPHGLANAIILPYVLEYYGESVHQSLAELADLVGISAPTDTKQQKAMKFIEAIKQLNQSMGIPKKFKGIVEIDIPLMVKRALAESNPLYPVPKIMLKEDMMKIYHVIKE
ncbi:iron-containing alcohol dehydrogenase [Desulfosporosinus sp. BICA1-9]|uniref:iron-containing alcohol dehydrogenase n=1 Tax=Desulfosporosinus sp. BICA1-9 TaxID=1531958 RepID=UPI00054C7D94|nr:iron-containing alcohol dehydrogenase [Desulfosporosinus sp. BICA1-9]KJS47115.1 MAG: alcohol dehydrogenase [Peptococcaceae bacterium BRH_c23]KJS79771.1 MAG: alcohol dehydrogenase [Desulfosporosinus sp. BICA1-9]HBW39037.1 alcohol dehydrogenase [Desulfosporosinus sp.]